MKLTQTKDYLLLIDEEVEIKDCYYWNDRDRALRYGNNLNHPYHYKILAYRKLNENAKELDLPLLPNPFNKQIDEVTYLKNLGHECFIQMKELNPSGGIKEFIRMAVEFGYKAAQAKQFSLEDMHQCWIQATRKTLEPLTEPGFTSFIQSLSTTQQLPKEFIPEYEIKYDNNINIPLGDYKRNLKTITNSGGKEEIVGAYKY